MNQSRETIYGALFALVSSAAPFAVASRRVRLIGEVQASQLPALYMSQVGESVSNGSVLPSRYVLKVDLAIYAQNSDANAPSAPQLNDLIDAVETALAETGGGFQPQTLGGLVASCTVSGDIAIFEGPLGNRAGAIIPVQIITA